MVKRIGVVVAVVALAVLILLPAMLASSQPASAQSPFNPGAFTQSIINRTFDSTFGSPSQSQYDRPVPFPPAGNVPAEGQQALCGNVVQNNAVPIFIQSLIANIFGLNCEPTGSFLDSFFGF